MKMKRIQKTLSLFLCMVLIVAMALGTIGCNGNTGNDSSAAETAVETFADGSVLGEGSKSFDFSVVDKDGTESVFEIHTDEETVGAALLEIGMIAGEDGPYGLYVKTVNGMTADYETDGVYWAFYVNDEYGQSGVDLTDITEGDTYSFRME